MADWCRRLEPGNGDTAAGRARKILVGAVEVDLGPLPGSVNWEIGGELDFELAAIAAGRDFILDEYVLFVDPSCLLANDEFRAIKFSRASLTDASDYRGSRGTSSGAEICICTGCGEDGACEEHTGDEEGSGSIHVFVSSCGFDRIK